MSKERSGFSGGAPTGSTARHVARKDCWATFARSFRAAVCFLHVQLYTSLEHVSGHLQQCLKSAPPRLQAAERKSLLPPGWTLSQQRAGSSSSVAGGSGSAIGVRATHSPLGRQQRGHGTGDDSGQFPRRPGGAANPGWRDAEPPPRRRCLLAACSAPQPIETVAG